VEVCALSALCAISPPFELKRDGTNGFQVTHDGLPTRRGRGPQVVVPSCQRPTHGKRTPGRTPAHRAIICSLSASSLGVGIQSGKRGQSVLFNDEQLTMAEKRCSRKRGRRSGHSCFRKLVAAARKERFGAKPCSAVCGEAAPEYELLVPH
jgi:hypothetical protein